MKSFETLPLFSTPLYIGKDELHPTIKKYAESVEYRKYEEGTKNDGHVGVTISKRSIHPDYIEGFTNLLCKHINNFLYNALNIDPNFFKYKFADSWFVKVRPGGYTPRHHIHKNSLFSGVYYINCPKDTGGIGFYKTPFFNGMQIAFDPVYKENKKNIFNAESWPVIPEAGDIVIFSSSLNHSILLNESEEDRYSFAFNIVPVGRIGRHTTGMLNYE